MLPYLDPRLPADVQARQLLADDDALGAFLIGDLDVPEAVAALVDAAVEEKSWRR
jgi:hypothetical protein